MVTRDVWLQVASQEIQQALEKQETVIKEKQESVMADLAQVEPAVAEAQQGMVLTGSF